MKPNRNAFSVVLLATTDAEPGAERLPGITVCAVDRLTICAPVVESHLRVGRYQERCIREPVVRLRPHAAFIGTAPRPIAGTVGPAQAPYCPSLQFLVVTLVIVHCLQLAINGEFHRAETTRVMGHPLENPS